MLIWVYVLKGIAIIGLKGIKLLINCKYIRMCMCVCMYVCKYENIWVGVANHNWSNIETEKKCNLMLLNNYRRFSGNKQKDFIKLSIQVS